MIIFFKKKHLKLNITNTCATDVCVEEHDHSSLQCYSSVPKGSQLNYPMA